MTLNANANQQLAFSLEKEGLASLSNWNGVTGYVTYTLSDQAKLIFTFNNPYTQAGSGDRSNVWFYTCIQPADGKYSDYYARTSGYNLDWQNPVYQETLNVVVDIYKQ